MAKSSFKMAGFSGFGNSPIKQKKIVPYTSEELNLMAEGKVSRGKKIGQVKKTDPKLATIMTRDDQGYHATEADSSYAADRGYIVDMPTREAMNPSKMKRGTGRTDYEGMKETKKKKKK